MDGSGNWSGVDIGFRLINDQSRIDMGLVDCSRIANRVPMILVGWH